MTTHFWIIMQRWVDGCWLDGWMDGGREGGREGRNGRWVGEQKDGWMDASQTLQPVGNSGAVFLTHRSCLCRALPNSLPENLLRLSPGLVLHVYTPGQWAIVGFWTGNLCSLEMGEGTMRKQSWKTWCQDLLEGRHSQAHSFFKASIWMLKIQKLISSK